MPDIKNNRLIQHINYRIRVTLQDTSIFIGLFKAFDKHMNLILADCEEIRQIKKRSPNAPSEQRRVLGFILLRGKNVVSLTIEGPPPHEDIPRVPILSTGGRSSSLMRVAGRGMSSIMPLEGPMRNIEDNPAISMDNDIPSLLSLRKQMMPPLPPTKKDAQPPMSGMGQMRPPPMPGLIPLRPLPETSKMGPPQLPKMQPK